MARLRHIEASLERVCFRTTLEGEAFAMLETLWRDPRTERWRQLDAFLRDASSTTALRKALEASGLVPAVNPYNAPLLLWTDIPKEMFSVALEGAMSSTTNSPLRFDAVAATCSRNPSIQYSTPPFGAPT